MISSLQRVAALANDPDPRVLLQVASAAPRLEQGGADSGLVLESGLQALDAVIEDLSGLTADDTGWVTRDAVGDSLRDLFTEIA